MIDALRTGVSRTRVDAAPARIRRRARPRRSARRTCSRSPRSSRSTTATGSRAGARSPRCVVLPGSTDEVQAVRPALRARGRFPSSPVAPAPASPAGRFPSPTGSSSRVARMNRILEIDLESAARGRRAGRRQPRRDARRRRRRLLLRARPVEPAGLHDRRQRRGELGRRALPQERLHGQPRHRREGRAARRRAALELGGKAIDGDDGPDLLGVVHRLGGHARDRGRGDAPDRPRCPSRS